MAQGPKDAPTRPVIDQAIDVASPLVLIALSYLEDALVEHGYAIEQHPSERLVRDDAWTVSVLSADGVAFSAGIGPDARAASLPMARSTSPRRPYGHRAQR
jgi:hypothetical protein